LNVALPVIDTPAASPQPTVLRLVRASHELDATWLLTTFETWAAYAVQAPQVRLARWSFVAGRDGRVVVRGAPLPPLPGQRFVDREGIVVPAGYTWSPAVDAQTVRQCWSLDRGECVLWMADGSCQRIALENWVQATRSAVRLTAREFVP
jgi:hypothetical protein